MLFSTLAKSSILLALWFPEGLAHMQMIKPIPIRSPLDSLSSGPKDYSYTSPLKSSGDDYPCKGYAHDTFVPQEAYVQGSSYTAEIGGDADHGGGSCQLALSNNKGQTFKVLESIEGGCGIAKNWTFQIPKDAPSGEALFAWTWFNKVGNREMYMNCAMVTIGGSDSHRSPIPSSPEATKRVQPYNDTPVFRRGSALSVNHVTDTQEFRFLPNIFVANVNGEGKCVTIEGEDVGFPLPGPNLIGKSISKGYKCSGNAKFLDSKIDLERNSF